MNAEALFTALSGSGVGVIVAALIAWARGRGGDRVSVADKWESVTTRAIDRAERQAEQWEQTAARVTAKLADCEAKVDELEKRLTEARALGRDMAADLDYRGADTSDYRRRLHAI